MIAPRVLLVTDPSSGDDVIVRCVERAARALPRGALCVQLRDKARGVPSLRMFAGRLRAVTRAVGASFVVNGQPVIARDTGADGVHFGAGSVSIDAARAAFPGAWVSVAAHSDDDVRNAVRDGADAILVSPIFASRPPGLGQASKAGRGLSALRTARSLAPRARLFALGGVDAGNAGACRAAGADGVAVMKALLASESPGRTARAIHDAVVPRW